MLSPATETAPNENQHLSSAQAKDQWKPQEIGNTKKKRITLPTPGIEEPLEEADPPPSRAAYGDPNKIAQYFPELNSGL
jgi:glutamine amidotransferase